jgi:purine-cytosine permease-like protein
MSNQRPALFSGIEIHSIDYVPLHERHGTVADQAKFWFLGNFNFATIAIGLIGPSMGLGFGFTVAAEAIGILTGTLFQAFHASQGAELGLPQMIQSRAQFGYRGVVVPLFASMFTFIGFNIVNTILIAEGLHAIAGWNKVASALGASAIGGVLAIWGYDWLHRVFKAMFWASVPLFALLTLAILLGESGHVGHADAGGFTAEGFFTQVAAGASYNITYAVFVSDYTRYLPHQTGRARIITAVFIASSVSAIWLIGLGAWLAVHIGTVDTLADLLQSGQAVMPGFGLLISAVSLSTLVAVIGMNAYSAMLTVLTAIDSFHPLAPTRGLRVRCIAAIIAGSAAAAIGFGGDVIEALNNYFVIMLYLLVPWTAVNLTDYFFVRRGHYAITHLFTPHGIYGAWGRQGLLAYALGFAASVPFCVMPGLFTGPAARALGGVDIGWLVGLIVTVPVYWWMMRGYRAESEAEAVAESGLQLGEGAGFSILDGNTKGVVK